MIHLIYTCYVWSAWFESFEVLLPFRTYTKENPNGPTKYVSIWHSGFEWCSRRSADHPYIRTCSFPVMHSPFNHFLFYIVDSGKSACSSFICFFFSKKQEICMIRYTFGVFLRKICKYLILKYLSIFIIQYFHSILLTTLTI